MTDGTHVHRTLVPGASRMYPEVILVAREQAVAEWREQVREAGAQPVGEPKAEWGRWLGRLPGVDRLVEVVSARDSICRELIVHGEIEEGADGPE